MPRPLRQAAVPVGHRFLLTTAALIALGSMSSLRPASFVDQEDFLKMQPKSTYNEHELQLYMHNRRLSLISTSSAMELGANGADAENPRLIRDYLSNWPGFEFTNDEEGFYEIFSNISRGNLIQGGNMCAPVKAWKRSPQTKKHVLIMHINENWGAFSSYIPNRTANWGDFMSTFISHGCTGGIEELLEYLNHPNLSAVFTTTMQSGIKPHPKVFSLPLGANYKEQIAKELHAKPFQNRTQLLALNFNTRNMTTCEYYRCSILKTVEQNFNHTLINTFNLAGYDYWDELRKSKFVLSPSGAGWDCYRTWEALMMGAIPVVETYYREDGYFKSLEDLPVLLVDHYANVTKALLEKWYPKIIARAWDYKFEKLTNYYWLDLIKSYMVASK